MIEFKNVSKHFGPTQVLHNIDLNIAQGEVVVIIGPSGSGKSTLLRCINKLEEITSGDLIVDGLKVNDPKVDERLIRQEAGMVFQQFYLFPHLTALENVMFGPLRVRGANKEEAEKLARELLAKVGLAERAHHYPSELSGGQQQRVAIARALAVKPKMMLFDEPTSALDPELRHEVLQLAHLLDRKPKALSGGQRQRVAIGRTLVAEPSVFLLDEPLSNLDAALRVQMRIEISRLHKRLGRTMIYVTHDQVEAMTLADKIVVLDAGRVAQVGKPLELYHYPADRFVAGFIGSPKMNFLPVKVTATAIDQVQVELPMPNRQQVWLPVESRDVQVGANMSLGIRPEHLLPSDIADVILEGEVQVVEQLGNETQIHIQIPSIRQNLVYRQNDVVLVEEGATFAIGLPPERCHLFREDGTACRRLHKEPGV